jgi:outer membrane protein TolC
MTTFMSKGQVDLLEPTGDIDKVVPRNFKLKDLIDSALANRGDVLALSQSVKSSQMALEMASKNRNMYISPSVWVSRTPSYSSSGADYNTSVASGFSITVPIPTNLLFNADITEASNNLANVEDYLADLKARVVVEVNQAYMQYGYAVDKLTAAQDDYKAAVSNAGNNVDSVLNLRDREGNLIDAKINHAKALIYLLKVSGDYKLPKI